MWGYPKLFITRFINVNVKTSKMDKYTDLFRGNVNSIKVQYKKTVQKFSLIMSTV